MCSRHSSRRSCAQERSDSLDAKTLAIVDTSSILYGLANNRSVFEALTRQTRYLPLVSKGIINELSQISNNKSSKGRCARLALKEIKLKNVKIDSSKEYPDKWIKGMRGEKGLVVITNDTALAKAIVDDIMVLKFSMDGRLRSFR